ncbi:MAG: hypothetical protein AB8B57_08315 [Congregibacter sp.]
MSASSTEAILVALFNRQGDWPQYTAIDEHADNHLELHLHVPASLACFAGHFPPQPVLPGVLQLHWVCQIAEAVLGYVDFSGVGNIKYNSMLMPNSECRLLIKPGDTSVRFRIEAGDTLITTGSISYRSRSQPPQSKPQALA